MDQDTAVKMIMRQVKFDEQIPDEYLGFVKFYLNLMYVMGWDARGNHLVGHNLRKVAWFKDGKLLQKYNSVKEAQTKNHYSDRIIQMALRTGEPTYRGDVFRYISFESDSGPEFK